MDDSCSSSTKNLSIFIIFSNLSINKEIDNASEYVEISRRNEFFENVIVTDRRLPGFIFEVSNSVVGV